MSSEPDLELREKLEQATNDDCIWGEVLAEHRGRLRTMVELRMSRLIRGRLDPSDVVQEAMLDASRRLPEYLQTAEVPFYVWLRSLTKQRLAEAHRRHLGTGLRDAAREVSIDCQGKTAVTSATLAARLIGRFTSPSEAAFRAEQRIVLQQVLDDLSEIDREILVLRHFEEMSNSEAAAALGLQPTAANNRYLRALGRLRTALAISGRLSLTDQE